METRLVVIKDFRDLDVYKLSNELACKVYKTTVKFPESERFGIVNQIQRAASSVGANIAEGSSRYHTKDYIKFLYIARGSLSEVLHFLTLSEMLGYIDDDLLADYDKQINSISLKINNLIAALSRQIVARSHKKPLLDSGEPYV